MLSDLETVDPLQQRLRDFQESSPPPHWKASVLWHSAFFMVQLSQLYVTTGKTIALIIWIFVSRVMSLLFNTLFVIRSFPAKKKVSSDFMASVTICTDFGAHEEEICHYFHLFRFYLPCSNGAGLEKAMAPHSSTLAWKIPWTEEPGRLHATGSPRVRHD